MNAAELEREAQDLASRARRLRRSAADCDTDRARQLRQTARELERKAREAEAEADRCRYA